MGKFSRTPTQSSPRSPVTTEATPTLTTFQGAPAFARSAKGELFVLAASNMVSEAGFYENGQVRDTRYRDLIAEVTAVDPGWVARFVPYLRNTMNLRSASLVMAAEYAIARKARGAKLAAPSVRSVVASALMRADEPGEFLAYWQLRTGKKSPSGGVQRGVADAVTRLLSEFAALKYDGVGNPWRLGDVIELVHPEPRGTWQSDLFKYLLDRRHHPKDVQVPESLKVVQSNRVFHETPKGERTLEVAAAAMESAGITWENLAGWLGGPMTAAAWELAIPRMGLFALVRNLRNFDEAGISKASVNYITKRLTDPEQIIRSRMLPMRFLSAYRELGSVRWSAALEEALELTLRNIPALPGNTLVLVDRSGSMSWAKVSEKSKLTCAEAASVFGTAIALRAEKADLIQYGTGHAQIPFRKGDALLPIVSKKFADMGGTNTAEAIRATYHNHDRVILVTDEQASGHRNPLDVIPKHVPAFVWNLAGIKAAHGPYGAGNRHQFAGLSDASFGMIEALEMVNSEADWPF